jgi:hypothetical protein
MIQLVGALQRQVGTLCEQTWITFLFVYTELEKSLALR